LGANSVEVTPRVFHEVIFSNCALSELPVHITIAVTSSIYIALAEDGSPVGAEFLGVSGD
jgi:hypothetical protein